MFGQIRNCLLSDSAKQLVEEVRLRTMILPETLWAMILVGKYHKMTATYDRFKKELAAQGRERLDGFSLNFSGLTDAERGQVRQELTALLRTDDRAPAALYALDGQASVPQIAAELSVTLMEAESYRLEAAGILCEATGDVSYVCLLEDLLLHATRDDVRRGAARHLAKVSNMPTVDSVLFDALSSEKDNLTRSSIAFSILDRVMVTPQAWKDYARRLTDGSQEEREKAYAELQELRKKEIG